MRSFVPLRKPLALAAVLLAAGPLAAEDWPQFRGPNCSGVSTAKLPLPVEFSQTKNVRWSAELGDGIGSPAVAAGRVFTTAWHAPAGEAPRLVVYAHDAATGKQLWSRSFAAGQKPMPVIEPNNSHASSSPAADAERVYVYFTRAGLLALDARTGADVWRYAVPEPFYIFDWGPGMSPVLHGELVLFCQDDDLSPALHAVDKKTGKPAWKDDRSDMAVCYSHPITCETPRGPEVVVAGTGKVLGYDPATGKRKWAAELFCRNIKTTPVTKDGIVYVSVSSQGISYQWRATADANKDGKITRAEIKASRKDKGAGIPDEFWKKFERGDANRDDVLENEEIDRAFLDPSNRGGLLDSESRRRGGNTADWEKWDADLQTEAYAQAIRGGGTGDVSRTHVVWKEKTKAVDHLVSPLLTGGRLWFVKGGGFASSFAAATGKPLWARERIGNDGDCLASPVAGDGKIYVASTNGKLVVLEDGPRLKVLARNDLGEGMAATPAIADGRLYVRTRTRLYCVANPE